MLFDTLKLSDTLGTAFTPEQARVLTKAFAEAGANELVTKTDLAAELAQLRAEIKSEFSDVRSEIGDVRTEIGDVRREISDVRTEVSKLRNDISLMRTDMVRWVVGALVFNVFTVAGLIISLGKLGH